MTAFHIPSHAEDSWGNDISKHCWVGNQSKRGYKRAQEKVRKTAKQTENKTSNKYKKWYHQERQEKK